MSFTFGELLAQAKQAESPGGSTGPAKTFDKVTLDPGIYTLRLKTVRRGTHPKTKVSQFSFHWAVMSGINKGKTVWHNETIGDRPVAAAILQRTLNLLGASDDFLSGNPTDDDLNNLLEGTDAKVEVTHSKGTTQTFVNYKVKERVEGIPDEAESVFNFGNLK